MKALEGMAAQSTSQPGFGPADAAQDQTQPHGQVRYRRHQASSRWAKSAHLYRGTVSHVRQEPFHYQFRHRTYYWLVDLDDMPRPPWYLRPLAGFKAKDHMGGPGSSTKESISAFVAKHGVDVSGSRFLMLCHARVFGYVFNPLTVFWCLDKDRLQCVVAEVHNTYGQRHRYFLRTDDQGRAEVDKVFYVSPFNPVDGYYRMRLPLPGRRLRIAVQLNRPDGSAFTAGLSGRRQRASTFALLAAAFRHPFSTVAVSAGIRWHGIRLYARRLPVMPRPKRAPQEGQS
ncbi:DUF1365 domain-containing protein [Natronoglycomyces albus]|uniref:DUF1365 domain-containing protein n=1 Tax=Natronoglycomyces albus TaxID=2811108 RepID=A0A895XSD0_9ACTN|nr:DUF1365 domain-containing protein [Natronoglycomyces albus]QSB06413.1 DUF1365 domain-containing protein [Natronoglycomyces albus]